MSLIDLFQNFSWVHTPRNKIVYYIQFYSHGPLACRMAAQSSFPPAVNKVSYMATSQPKLGIV